MQNMQNTQHILNLEIRRLLHTKPTKRNPTKPNPTKLNPSKPNPTKLNPIKLNLPNQTYQTKTNKPKPTKPEVALFFYLINAVKAWVCYAFGNVVYMSNGSNNIWFPKITLCQSAFLGTALLQNFGIHCFFDTSFLPYHHVNLFKILSS